MPRRIDNSFIAVLAACRWLMAPLYLGLIGVMVLVGVEFFRVLGKAIFAFNDPEAPFVIVVVLKLIDLVLIGQLTFITVVAGFETLRTVSFALDGTELPRWAGRLDFTAIKLKLISSIVAIAAVDLLETYFDVDSVAKADVLWKIAILLTFVVAGLLLVAMDRLAAAITHPPED